MKKNLFILLTFSLAVLLMLSGSARVYSQADTVNIVFLTDDTNDDFHYQYLVDQGFNVKKFWGGSGINNWGDDTIEMLDTADLVVLGRSLNSGEFGDSIERVHWNAIKAPMFYISAFHVRNNRNHLFNSSYLVRSDDPNPAVAKMPDDTVFSNVTLGDGNTIKWFELLTDGMIDTTGTSNGEWVASIGDTIPVLVRFEANKPFYQGGPDSAVAERIFWGFGKEAYDDKSPQAAHFPLTRAAKQVYLNEINRVLGRPVVDAVIDNTWDYNVIFLSDDDNDNAHYEYLLRQDLNVTKMWPASGNINTWTEDTLAMLDMADLVILGRSLSSGNFEDSIDRVHWNAIETPVFYISPFFARDNRNHLFKSRYLLREKYPDPAVAMLPADEIFDDITLGDGNTMTWFDYKTDAMVDTTGTSNGEWVISVGDTVPLLVRFEADKPFYEGGPDSAVAERIFWGFGVEPYGDVSTQTAHFPLSRVAKKVYLNEISRILGITPPAEAVYGAPDYTITFLTDDDNDDTQISWLKAQGFPVHKFWIEGDEGNIVNWPEDTMKMLDEADIIICGRSLNSSEFGDTARFTWNAIKAPLVLNSIHAGRSSRINWFNTTSILDPTTPVVAETDIPDDVVFTYVEDIDSAEFLLTPTNALRLPDTVTTNGTLVVSQGDSVMSVVRFETGTEFYPGAGESADGPRTFFAFGGEPKSNHFPLTETAQAVYFAEIMRILGGEISEPTYFGTLKTLSYLATDLGALDPSFAQDVTSYTVALTDTATSVEIFAVGADATGSVEGGGVIAIPYDKDTTLYVISASGIGQTTTYSILIDQPVLVDIKDLETTSSIAVYPNPFIDGITISSDDEMISDIAIYDLKGVLVMRRSINSDFVELDLTSLSSGAYIIKIRGDANVVTNRIIKL